ncbi:cocosin 1-like [Wolffia australiana]
MASVAKSPALCYLLFCASLVVHGCLGQMYPAQRRVSGESSCRLENLRPQEARRRVESEAGVSEFWDSRDQQFDCAGVAAVRNTIEPRGLMLPEFSNSPRLVYIVQGSGISGVVIPGCPETFQSMEHGQERRERREERHGERVSGDQHQKIRRFRQGDIIALPAGVAHWCYNNGDKPVIAVTVFDVANQANQLDRSPRRSFLAGQQRGGEEKGEESSGGGNVFRGFDDEILSEALGVRRDVVRKLKGEDDRRGTIIKVEKELHIAAPSREMEMEMEEDNGLEEALCNMRLVENIADPAKFDVYSPQGGHISTLNSQKLPILRFLRLSAEKGHLRRNAIVAPLWHINAHSVLYVIRGTGRVQISGAGEKLLFDGTVRRGQMLVVPQGHAVVKRAEEDEFEWVAFKTNDYAMVSPLAGKTSVLRGIPIDVLANSYRISEEEVRKIKFARDDETLFLRGRRASQ